MPIYLSDENDIAVLNRWANETEARLDKATKLIEQTQNAVNDHQAKLIVNDLRLGGVSSVAGGNLGWTTTTTSVHLYWDGTNGSVQMVIFLPNTTSVYTVPGGNQNVTGLVANTSYYFYPFLDPVTKKLTFLTGGTGSPAIAQTGKTTALYTSWFANKRQPLANQAIKITTPASGTGSGTGGGSSCISQSMNVSTPAGVLSLMDVRIGQKIDGPDGQTHVASLTTQWQGEMVTVDFDNGDTLECSLTHPLVTKLGPVKAGELSVLDLVRCKGGFARVKNIKVTSEPWESVLVRCSPTHEYYTGRNATILVHNGFNILK